MSAPANKNLPAKVESPGDPAAALAKLLEDFGPQALAKVNEMDKAFKLAEGVKQVHALVKSVIGRIMPLQGSNLGFRTDLDTKGGYSPEVIAECATEALLRGLRLTGNEWNIIKGRCYVAQAGCARLVAEIPGLTDLELSPGVPTTRDGGAVVEYAAHWKIDGKPMSLTRKIPVKLNEGMGADGALGKAKRKMLASIYERVTGSVLSDGESDEPPMLPPAPAKAGQLAERMRDKVPAARPAVEVLDDGVNEPPGLFGNDGQQPRH